MRIVVATGNAGKMREFKEILSDIDMEILSMRDAGVACEIDENGTTFEENAVIKANAVRETLGDLEDTIIIADDSGLEIDAMNGEPGVRSARFMDGHSYHEKNAAIIERLDGIPNEKRSARFRCCIAAIMPDGDVRIAEGKVEGRIGYEEKGENGFGYDPIFIADEAGSTFAEIDGERKNEISHRGRAIRKLKEML